MTLAIIARRLVAVWQTGHHLHCTDGQFGGGSGIILFRHSLQHAEFGQSWIFAGHIRKVRPRK
jgi:hypothetical protein